MGNKNVCDVPQKRSIHLQWTFIYRCHFDFTILKPLVNCRHIYINTWLLFHVKSKGLKHAAMTMLWTKMIRIEAIFTSSSTLNFFRFFLTLGDVSAGTSPLAIAETNSCRLRCTKWAVWNRCQINIENKVVKHCFKLILHIHDRFSPV